MHKLRINESKKIDGEVEKRNGRVNAHRRLRRRKFQGKVKWSNIEGRGSHEIWDGKGALGPLRNGGVEGRRQVAVA